MKSLGKFGIGYLAKVEVEGSNPFFLSKSQKKFNRVIIDFFII
ncbi:hypothetical protein OA322_00470 [bacterium]|nr:hypothetical protein [bacterium]